MLGHGWWLVLQKCINIRQQHVGWPMANPKNVQKLSSFDEKRAVNVQLFSSGQLWQCAIPSQMQYSWNHLLEGSAHTTSGDARSGNEDQNWFLKKSDNPDSEGMIGFPAQEVRPPTDWRCNWPCWQQGGVDTVQWTICCARGTWHWLGAGSTELCAKCEKHWTF